MLRDLFAMAIFDPFPVKMVWFLPPECKEPLGMESGAISDKQVTASSTYNHFYNPAIGRLHHKAVHDDESRGGAWIALHNNLNQWLQIDLGPQRTTVKMVATQGRYGRSQWVKRYRLQYSLDGGSFRYYNKVNNWTLVFWSARNNKMHAWFWKTLGSVQLIPMGLLLKGLETFGPISGSFYLR